MTNSPYESNDEAFFAAVGRLALAWGMIDAGLTVLVNVVYTRYEGQKIEDEIPWSLTRKIRFLRRCFSRIEIFKPSAQIFMPILNEVSKASETRHDIIHGILLSIPEAAESTQMARFLRGQRPGHRAFSISTAEILESAKSARDLGGRIVNVTLALGEFTFPGTKESE